MVGYGPLTPIVKASLRMWHSTMLHPLRALVELSLMRAEEVSLALE